MTYVSKQTGGDRTEITFETEDGVGGQRMVHGLPAAVVTNIADTAARLATIVTSLSTIAGHVDGLEGYTDGLETLVGTTNTSLTALAGYVDGLETLVTSTNSALTTLQGLVDGLEGYLDTVEAKLDALNPSTAGTPFQKAAGTSAVQLDSVACTSGCWVKNISTLSQMVYVGRSGVAAGSGYQLGPGEERFFPCRNADEWYVIASAASSNSCVLPV